MANGKGDTPRPLSVPREEYESAWARTFGEIGATDFTESDVIPGTDTTVYADDAIYCEACGDECPGTSECNGCMATLCENCASEYDDACSLCWHDDDE